MATQTYKEKMHCFCSEPCKWIFNLEPEKYTNLFTQDEVIAQGIVKREDLGKFWDIGAARNGLVDRN